MEKTHLQIVIGILVLVILALAYYAWANRCVVAKIEGELGKEVAELEVLLAEVGAEHFADAQKPTEKPEDAGIKGVEKRADQVDKELSRRDRIEAKVRKIQTLHKAGKIKLSPTAQARLRRAVAQADDYLVSSSDNVSKESAQMIRRLRDAVLVMVVKGRKPFCDMAKREYERAGDMLQKLSKLSKSDLEMKVTPDMVQQGWEARNERNNESKPATVAQADTVVIKADTPAISSVKEYLASGGSAADAEKYLLIDAYQKMSSAVCSDMLKSSFGQARSQVAQVMPMLKMNGVTITKEELLEFGDALEVLMLDVQKKMCPNGKLDHVKIYQVYMNLMELWCKDDDYVRDLISQPLELTLNKHYAAFA